MPPRYRIFAPTARKLHDPDSTTGQRFVRELTRQKVAFIMVGLSAAALQGAPMVTQNIDLWFRDIRDPGIQKALKKVGGTWVPSINLHPPLFLGPAVEIFDIVLTVHGIGDFDEELVHTLDIRLGKVTVKVLRLDRIIASKKYLNRPKDRMVLPALKSAAAALLR